MGCPTALSDLTLQWPVTLKGENHGHSDFKTLYIMKGVELDPMVLFNVNRKPHIGSPVVPSHLTLNYI